MSETPAWELALANYTDEEREQLEAAADAQSERIEKAAKDPSNTGVVDGIDISELWFAVLRERDKVGKKAPSTTAKGESTKPVEPVEEPAPPEAPGDNHPEAAKEAAAAESKAKSKSTKKS